MRQRRQSRIDATIALFKSRKHEPVPLPDVQCAAGAQHGARLAEIRALGYIVDNEMKRTASGEIHSFYTLRSEPGEALVLFPGALEPRHRDDN